MTFHMGIRQPYKVFIMIFMCLRITPELAEML